MPPSPSVAFSPAQAADQVRSERVAALAAAGAAEGLQQRAALQQNTVPVNAALNAAQQTGRFGPVGGGGDAAGSWSVLHHQCLRALAFGNKWHGPMGQVLL